MPAHNDYRSCYCFYNNSNHSSNHFVTRFIEKQFVIYDLLSIITINNALTKPVVVYGVSLKTYNAFKI